MVTRRRYDPLLDAAAALCGAAAGVVIVHAGVFLICWLLLRKAVKR